ncbi:hypothetical protein IVA80_25245 [Bradyrhizobium sp. 139]|nr:hypothetical protein [Bradyrhizobium sp. 139]MCK1744054.1 hypothetical protein [Bradyrhizobium sp. 139]
MKTLSQPVSAGGAGRRQGRDARDASRDFDADGVDEGIAEDVELPARRLVEQTAESRDPVFAGKGRAAEHRFSDSGLQESLDLEVTTEFFDSKVRRIALMRINQHGRNAGTAEHCGGGRAGQSPPIVALSVYRTVQISAEEGRLMHQQRKSPSKGYKSTIRPDINNFSGWRTGVCVPISERRVSAANSDLTASSSAL